jgi:glycosyltransferase involved in cell wall biosynthesis
MSARPPQSPLPPDPSAEDCAGLREEIDLTIFVPCFNEESRVTLTLETVEAALKRLDYTFEVIVVDDGSTDNTAAVIEEFCRTHPEMPVRLHRNPRNLGLSRCFVDTAFRGRGRYYRLVCGDNVEPEESMVKILGVMGQADVILPFYPVLPGKSRTRKFISGLFTKIVNLFSGQEVKYYNGCALYRRFHVMRWASHNYGFGFQAHLISTLLDEGASSLEIPLEGFHFTKERGSPINLRNFISTAHTLSEILIRRLRRKIYGA